MAERHYIPVRDDRPSVFALTNASDVGMLQVWSEGGRVRFALITASEVREFSTAPEFAGGLANRLLLCETEAKLGR